MFKRFNLTVFFVWVVYPILFLGVILFIIIIRIGYTSNSTIEQDNLPEVNEFTIIQVPEDILQPSDRAKYLANHYWDNFDFSNSNYLNKPDITEQAFVNYLEVLKHTEKERSFDSILIMLKKAESSSEQMFLYFLNLFDKYLYHYESPLQNQELYISVLEFMIKSTKLDNKIKEEAWDLLYALDKSHIGCKAGDFKINYKNGKSSTLYNIIGTNTLLFFYNLDSQTSNEIYTSIKSSQIMNSLLENGKLNIISVFPQKNKDLLLSSMYTIPDKWIDCYDDSEEIKENKIFDLRVLPVIYLLDSEKKIILKEIEVLKIENYLKNYHGSI